MGAFLEEEPAFTTDVPVFIQVVPGPGIDHRAGL
jgi:hypothetical protein